MDDVPIFSNPQFHHRARWPRVTQNSSSNQVFGHFGHCSPRDTSWGCTEPSRGCWCPGSSTSAGAETEWCQFHKGPSSPWYLFARHPHRSPGHTRNGSNLKNWLIITYYGLEMVWVSTLYSRLMTYVCGLVMGDGYNFNVHGLGSTLNTASNDGQTGIWMCPNMRDWRIYPQKYGNCWEGKWWSTI